MYVLTKEEGGRHTPFFNGYRPQFYFRTTDVTGVATLPEGVEMVMPGDNVEMEVELITPIAMEKELRFAIREGGRTVGRRRRRRDHRSRKGTMLQKIRIKLKSYDHATLDQSASDIVRTARRTGAMTSGPVPLPTQKTVYTVLRSPHVDKKSREQFEIRIHKRLIDITRSSAQTMEALEKLDVPAGVDIEIKT